MKNTVSIFPQKKEYMSKFNTKNTGNKTNNLAGGNAYGMNPKEELVHAVLTTFLEDKFYESGDERLNRIKLLITKCEPEFVAKLAVVAREEFNLRSVSHALVGELALQHKLPVKDLIVKIAIRPDDLLEIASYVGMPMPKQVKRGIRNALLKFNRYQLAKYKNEGKEMSLVDLFNLTHPKVKHANEAQRQAWVDLMTGKLVSTDTWESELSKNPSKEVWERLLSENKIGYMALIRNLNNLVKYGISDEYIQIAIDKLINVEEIRKSRQMPFRFYTAYENVKGNRKLLNAVSDAMDIAVSNTPELLGKTLIAVDCSGSMRSCIDKAAIFGATLMKANVNADVVLYDTQVKEFNKSTRVPVVDIAQSIVQSAMGGGTATSLVFDYALIKNKVYDRIIIISDNESWDDTFGSVQAHYTAYRNKLNCDPFIYAIDIQGHGTKDIQSPKVKNLCGWSDRLLDFINESEKGDSLIRHIESKEYK